MNPWYMADYRKDREIITVALEVPDGKSPKEIEGEFKKIKPFGFEFESMYKIAFEPNKEGGNGHDRK